MSLIRLNIKGISYSQTQTGAYALILSEDLGERKLPIVIGAFEAQSIAIALEKEIRPPRPLTHDLFKTFADRYHILVKQVIIHKLADGVFYSSIIAEQDGLEEIIDARTSDAIALALRFNAPIFTYKDIMDRAGVHLKSSSATEEVPEVDDALIDELLDGKPRSSPQESPPIDHDKHTLKELKELLKKALNDEAYEAAAKLRDEISKRNI